MKILQFNKQAQDSLITGVNTLGDAVSTTLGPKGANVMITQKLGVPNVTHDGVTVAKEIDLKDPFQNAGVQVIRQAASQTNDTAGDGTTTATIIAQALVNEGFKVIREGANPQFLKTGIEQAVEKVIDELDKIKKPVKTDEEIFSVASISAASTELGKIVFDAVKLAGTDGVVSLNEVPAMGITIDHVKGLEIDRGYVSNYFITDDKKRANVANPYILITDQKVVTASDIVPILDLIPGETKDIVVIADEIEGEALAILVTNKLRGNFKALAVRAPAFGMRRKQLLEDIAVLTGGRVISEDAGRTLADVELSDLGRCERIESKEDTTLFVNGHGPKENIDHRVEQIKNELKEASNEYEKDLIKQRLAKLTSGVVVVNVGAATETEMKERKARIEDAVNATRAAIEEGVVAGGETSLLKASRVLNKKDEYEKVLWLALIQPFKKLMDNSGLGEAVSLQEQAAKAGPNVGINVMTGKLTNLIEDGVIDPVKVSKCALRYASSAACMILTTKVIIVDEPEVQRED